jgi:ABC-type nitrate/sulfonate/bicarbonate transport system ATPase subunit
VSERLGFDHVTKIFETSGSETGFVAFDDVTLEASPSEFLAIVGPSGCGKSTLLKMAAGLMPPPRPGPARRQACIRPASGVIYLFQQYAKSLFAWRTVIDNVMFPLEGALAANAANCGTSAGTISNRLALSASKIAIPGSYLEGCSSASPSRALWPPILRSSCWTSRSVPSMR